jgi:hypothetical protein
VLNKWGRTSHLVLLSENYIESGHAVKEESKQEDPIHPQNAKMIKV